MDIPDLQVASQVVTLRSALGETLRAAILSGRFAPGQRLVERELCALTGASRASVREAMRQLEAEGLVVTRPHRGPSVMALSAEDARQLYGVRGVLLGYAARLCAEARPPDPMAAMVAATAAVAAAAEVVDTPRLVAAGDDFHEAIAVGSGNAVLRQMLGSVHNRLRLLRNLSMARPERVRVGAAAYQAIRDAILAGDAPRAESLCIRHNDAGQQTAVTILAECQSAKTKGKAE